MAASREHDKLGRKLYRQLKRASLDYGLFTPGDHVLACLSGGKDSYTMLAMMRELQRRVPFDLRITAFHLDQKQPGYPADVMADYLASQDIPHVIQEADTYSIVMEKLAPDATPCSLCSRLRRGIIYKRARELGCNKIALGHHRDDSIETLLLNLLHTGSLEAMPAIYTTDDGEFEVVRPLIYCAEDDIEAYSVAAGFPIIPCNLCGSIEGRRGWTKQLLTHIEQTVPQARGSLLAAMKNVKPSHLLDLGLQERLGVRAEDEDDVLRLVTNRPATE